MRKHRLHLIFAIIMLASCLPLLSAETSAQELLKAAEHIIFPAVYHAKLTITTVKPGQTNANMSMEIFYKEGTGSFIEMTSPARSKGLRFLEQDASLYMFNPKSNSSRPLRLSPEKSFQGTVFSNNDMSDQQYSNDYEATFGVTEKLDYGELGTIECKIIHANATNPQAPYGSLKIWMNSTNNQPLRFDYYAKSGSLFKSMILENYRQIGGQMRPTLLHMDSFEITGEYSEVTVDSLEKLDDIPASKFTTSELIK